MKDFQMYMNDHLLEPISTEPLRIESMNNDVVQQSNEVEQSNEVVQQSKEVLRDFRFYVDDHLLEPMSNEVVQKSEEIADGIKVDVEEKQETRRATISTKPKVERKDKITKKRKKPSKTIIKDKSEPTETIIKDKSKPTETIVTRIEKAINSSEAKWLPVEEIYAYFYAECKEFVALYKGEDVLWKSCVRHALDKGKFLKQPTQPINPQIKCRVRYLWGMPPEDVVMEPQEVACFMEV